MFVILANLTLSRPNDLVLAYGTISEAAGIFLENLFNLIFNAMQLVNFFFSRVHTPSQILVIFVESFNKI